MMRKVFNTEQKLGRLFLFVLLFAMLLSSVQMVVCKPSEIHAAKISRAKRIGCNAKVKGKAVVGVSKYYKFTLKKSAKIRFVYSKKCTSSERIEIYNNKYKEVESWYVYYDSNRRVVYGDETLFFVAGTYYIKLDENYKGKFKLKLNTKTYKESFPEKQTKRNDVLRQAKNVNFDRKYVGVVGVDDEQDFYKFKVPYDADVIVNYKLFGGNGGKYEILDSKGDYVASGYVDYDDNKGYAWDEAVTSLEKGTYYFKVVGYGGWDNRSGLYNFTLSYE